MPRTKRQYGKQTKRTKAERLFAELPQSPVKKQPPPMPVDRNDDKESDDNESDQVSCLTSQLLDVQLEVESKELVKAEQSPPKGKDFDKETQDQAPTTVTDKEMDMDTDSRARLSPPVVMMSGETEEATAIALGTATEVQTQTEKVVESIETKEVLALDESPEEHIGDISSDSGSSLSPPLAEKSMRVLKWEDVCPPEDTITKIAEASYAEVYRVSNKRGVSIMKVIRLQSPIKPQTKAQVKSGLVDEEPHREEDIDGELRISEWLAEIPGFVVYKEKYIVQGKATKALLETHQTFQKKMKKEDPGRAQFYPSPSRYLDDTKFVVVELGDAGTALEDWPLQSSKQLWDIFLLVAIALARAEEVAMFEHRDLHEGNLCIKQVRPPRHGNPAKTESFGNSGLDITILDYGISRAQDTATDDAATHDVAPVAFDLETGLSLFTSTHAAQCKVYRQMRSYLLRGDRSCLPPEAHNVPYEAGINGPLDWKVYQPYTNVLWLAYLYSYMIDHFKGPRRELLGFKEETAELWSSLDPDAPKSRPLFESATSVVSYAFLKKWVRADQLEGISEASLLLNETSIVMIPKAEDDSETE